VTQATPLVSSFPVPPSGSDYPVMRGTRYRATVSVSNNFDRGAIAGYLVGHGWSSVQLWEGSDPLPADWPSGEHLSGLEDNHRWLRGEATRSGESSSLGTSSPWPFTIYRVANLWRVVAAPAPSAAAPTSAPPVIGPGAGPMGLDPGIPQHLGAAVFRAWSTETDPAALRALAATLRMGGYPIAADVLDQQALQVEGPAQPQPPARPRSRRALHAAAAIGGFLLSMLASARR